MTQVHVEPLFITLVKGKYDGKLDKDSIKLVFHRDPMSSTLELYEFSIYFFDNGNPEEFFLFMRNFDMTIMESGTLETVTKVQHLCTLVRREALRQFYLFSTDI